MKVQNIFSSKPQKRSRKKSRQQSLLVPGPKRPARLLLAAMVGIGLLGSVLWLYQTRAVGDAKLLLSSPEAPVLPGETFTVDITVDAGIEPVNVVQANLAYPVDKLEYIGTDVTGSAFPNAAQLAGGDGTVMIGRYTNPSETVSGNVLVAKVTFRALTATGTAEIGISAGSQVVRAMDSVDVLVNRTGATITVVAPQPPSGITTPTVTIISPVDSTEVTKNTHIQASAADTNKITMMEVYVDGE